VTDSSNFLAAVTDGEEQAIAATIEAFIVATYDDCIGDAGQKSACWFTLRVTKPSTEFAIPRWHQDGCMFSVDEGCVEVVRSKYALTLLGAPTLMLQPHAHVFETIREGEETHVWRPQTDQPDAPLEPTAEEEDEVADSLRVWLAERFHGTERVQVGSGQVVRFSWGRDDSPVHSEPDSTTDRVFMSILYGSEAEVRGMCGWRDVEYGAVLDGSVCRPLSSKQAPNQTE